jgi:hypothetical protein
MSDYVVGNPVTASARTVRCVRIVRLVATLSIPTVPMACATPAPSAVTAETSPVVVLPPAVTALDDTVSVTLALADSFTALPDGTCEGRSSNAGIANGAQAQLRGNIAGGSVSSTVTTHYRFTPPAPGRETDPAGEDDGEYCIVTAVFAPTRPDPDSRYLIKFPGGDWRGLVHVGRERYGRLDRPGYGSTFVIVQTCQRISDPPDKQCPE